LNWRSRPINPFEKVTIKTEKYKTEFYLFAALILMRVISKIAGLRFVFNVNKRSIPFMHLHKAEYISCPERSIKKN